MHAMGQLGFFDLNRRYEGLDKKKDPLVTLAHVVPWESFRPLLSAALAQQGTRTAPCERKSAAGRKPWDEVLMFKALVVQALYNLCKRFGADLLAGGCTLTRVS